MRLVLMDKKSRLEREFADAFGNRKVMESHKALGSTCCPQCGHAWIAGYSDEKFQALMRTDATEYASLELARAVARQLIDAVPGATQRDTLAAWC